MGDYLVVPIEKYFKSEIFDYDIKVKYYPESDEAMVLYKATLMLQDMICMLLKQQMFYQTLMRLSL